MHGWSLENILFLDVPILWPSAILCRIYTSLECRGSIYEVAGRNFRWPTTTTSVARAFLLDGFPPSGSLSVLLQTVGHNLPQLYGMSCVVLLAPKLVTQPPTIRKQMAW